jgi:tRNA G18 (ribose-2'-O)-methylase SpoU
LSDNNFDYTPDSDGVVVCDIDDPDDARLDNFRDLNSIDRRPDLPSGKGLVIAEGVLVVQRMLASPFTPLAFLGTDRRLAELKADLAGNAAPYYRVSAEVMAQAVGLTSTPSCSAADARIRCTGVRCAFRWATPCWCRLPGRRTGRTT